MMHGGGGGGGWTRSRCNSPANISQNSGEGVTHHQAWNNHEHAQPVLPLHQSPIGVLSAFAGTNSATVWVLIVQKYHFGVLESS